MIFSVFLGGLMLLGLISMVVWLTPSTPAPVLLWQDMPHPIL